VSIDGHFPYATDIDFQKYLVVGPIARYAEDLKPMLSVMAGDKASKLKLYEKVIPMLKQLELILLITGTYRETNTILSQGYALIP
jgi:Asp-tRNA(Asn)/Glu-tRNA(Gln) amidotransferase A subunit family amidase